MTHVDQNLARGILFTHEADPGPISPVLGRDMPQSQS